TLFYVTISAAADVPRPQITVQSATGLPVLGRPVGTCWQPEGADEPDCLEEQPVFLTDDVFHVGEAVDVRTLWPTPPDRVDMTLYISIDYAAVVDSITDVPAADGLTFRWAPEANPGSYVLRVQAFWPQGEQSADYFVHVGPEPRTPPTIMIWALGGGFQPGIEGDSCWQGSCRELPIRSDMPPGTPVVTPFQLAANWPDGPAEVTMTVYDAADRERPLHRAAFAPPPSSSVLWAPPQNLPPGEYVLVTTFRWPEGEVTRGFPVRVIGSQLPR
ncbi:MAG: hypothetical protein GYB64_07790, partial [Chloroflexi bacterium]|nr:hypothetical protein [Chloroflexota bacterium]